VYGSIHGCVNFLLVARVIFVFFRAIFVGLGFGLGFVGGGHG
jgi:hypothetical protein